MNAVFHAINIGTLATWLSVTGFGTVAGLVPVWQPERSKLTVLEALPVSEDFEIGAEEPSSDPAPAATPEGPVSPMTELPTPPELPSLAEAEPLPEVPDLPAPKPLDSVVREPVTPKVNSRPAVPSKPATASRSSTKPTSNTNTANPGSASGAQKTSGSGSGSGSVMSNSARLAAGRMNAPSYPSYSRRNNQTGTVIVEFTVDTTGRVISAYAKKSSSWPLLDNEAVRTVRSWKFPPGGIMKLQRPIVFRLN